MDPSQDCSEEQPAPSGEQRDNPTDPVLFCDVHLSQRDVRNWNKKDAFRHFYLNWREGMNQVFQFTTRPSIHHTETNDVVYINAAQPIRTNPSWGFILFNKEKGMLSLNIREGLKLRRYLDQGQMSVSSNNLLKAAMAMTLAGYQVRFESRENKWDFFFNEMGSFCFTRVESTEVAFLSSLNQFSNGNPPPENVSTEDLAITIGPGESATHRRVTREQCIKWLGITIEITNFLQPHQVIYTPSGDLILDHDFASRAFVNGVQVSVPKAGSFLLGYQFRDEELVSDTGELILCDKETMLRTRIWEAVMDKNEYNVKVLTAFLRFDPDALDVRGVGRFLGYGSVRRVWGVLVGELGREKIFCQETDDFREVNQRTNRAVAVVPNTLWSTLRSHRLIRTWAEELLYKAPPSEPLLDTPFAITVKRAFDALLHLDPKTANLSITWVDHPLGPPLMHADAHTQRIVLSKYWLHFGTAHALSSCRLSDLARQRVVKYNYLQCDHIVIAMHTKLVELITTRSCDSSPVDVVNWARDVQKMAGERLEEMPRCVVAVGDAMDPGRVFVTWEIGLSEQAARFVGSGYHIVLHKGVCRVALVQLLHSGPVLDISSTTAPCGCPQKIVGRQETLATFEDLSPKENFIPTVALNSKGSIYAASSKPHNPNRPASAASAPAPAQEEPQPPFNAKENWQRTNFPVLFAQFTPRIGITGPGSDSIGAFPPVPVSVLEIPRLRFRFERCQYVNVRARLGLGEGNAEQFIMYVHGIHVPGAMNPTQGEGRLTVTVLSFLRTTPLCLFYMGLTALAQGREKGEVGLRELLLHYQDFDAMGYRQDAIVLPIESIETVKAVSPASLGPFEAVQYTADAPDPSRTGYYCRFAVRCNGPADSAVVMPVASHLLTHSKRWPEPRYTPGVLPSVIDLTPGCLGPAEGFAQTGARIDAAVGFDPARNCTWKARYPYAKVYDGRIETVLTDLKRKRLSQPPCDPRGPAPRILLLSLPEREKSLQQWDRSLEDAQIFRTIPLILSAFTQKPDFLVLSLPPWVLAERAWHELFGGLWTLLTSRYAVHLRKVTLTDYGLARDGCMLVIVASCVPTPIPWKDIFRATATNNTADTTITVQSVIQDLAFANPRATGSSPEHGFICKNPQTGADVYNHQTSPQPQAQPNAPLPLPQDHNLTAPLSIPKLATTTHPLLLPPAGPVLFPATRPRPTLPSEYWQPVRNVRGGDVLSVRELARVQGFPDDFVFLGTVGVQRSEVVGAWPVLVGWEVGVGVLDAVGGFGGVVSVAGSASVSVSGNGNTGARSGASMGGSGNTGASTGNQQRQGQKQEREKKRARQG